MLALSWKIDDWIPIIFVGGLALFAWGIKMRFQKKRAEQRGRTADQIVSHSKPSEIAAMSRELASLVVELEETSRRIAAQIDNRYQRLDAMIAEADEKIARLEKLKRELGIADSENQNASQPAWPPTSPTPTQPLASPAAATPPLKLEPDPQHANVYALADRGKSSREIAIETGKQPGEVELILALRAGR